MSLSVLYVGANTGTCLQRANALRGLGHRVLHLPTDIPRARRVPQHLHPHFNLYRLARRIQPHPDVYAANWRARWAARRGGFDLVWIDKGLSIAASTLDRLRERLPGARLVAYSPDDMLNPVYQSPRYREAIDRYDLHVTTKSYNLAELRALGARDVLFVDNAFDPATHRPVALSREEQARFGAEVGFVGGFEPERAELMHRLAAAGVPVTVRGPDWRRFGKSHPMLRVIDTYVDDADYARVLCATRINLGFLRKVNRDLQTTRSVEIPACGGFLLAERTGEHRRLFQEGREAEFFGDFAELLAKCRHYLAHESQRRQIAEAGRRRCQAGYSNPARLSQVLAYLASAHWPRKTPSESRKASIALAATACPSAFQ